MLDGREVCFNVPFEVAVSLVGRDQIVENITQVFGELVVLPSDGLRASAFPSAPGAGRHGLFAFVGEFLWLGFRL